MSRPNRVSRNCAAPCVLLEFAPLRGATSVWAAWLLIAAAVCLAAGIGWPARVAIWSALAVTWPSYRRFVGEGERAVKAAGHDDCGFYFMLVTAPDRKMRATEVEIRRFGNLLWVLRFSSRQGSFWRAIRPGSQEPRALRRLLRQLALPAGAGRCGPIRAPAGE